MKMGEKMESSECVEGVTGCSALIKVWSAN